MKTTIDLNAPGVDDLSIKIVRLIADNVPKREKHEKVLPAVFKAAVQMLLWDHSGGPALQTKIREGDAIMRILQETMQASIKAIEREIVIMWMGDILDYPRDGLLMEHQSGHQGNEENA